MCWNFRKDFFSLFTRTYDTKYYFYPVDGLRAIASLLIILCNLLIIFNTFIPSYPHKEWEEYLQTIAIVLLPLMVYSVETFFMLSGFLLTYKLIRKWKKNYANYHLFLQRYRIFVLKRALRFWPGMLLSTLVMVICGEPRYPNSSFLFEFIRHLSVWMFFQNYFDIEYLFGSLAPLWSVSLHMQIHIILPLVLYLFYSYKKSFPIYYSLGILLLLSIILPISIYNPTIMTIQTITRQYHNLPLLLPTHYIVWLQKTYNLTFPFENLQSNPMKIFFHTMYLPIEAHFGSFIIGALLAVQLIYTPWENNQHYINKKLIFLTLIFFYILLFVMMNVDTLSLNYEFFTMLSIASSTQLFALSQAFILFTTVCPSTHPYHSPRIKRFLSLSIWIPISRLSYLVYLIHWRISFELIFGGPLLFLKTYSITYAIMISLPIVLFVSQFISCIWYLLIEKPIERAISFCFDGIKMTRCYLN